MVSSTAIEDTDIRSYLMELLRSKSGLMNNWMEFEPELQVKISQIPDPLSAESKKLAVEKIKDIHSFCLEKGVASANIDFLLDACDRLKNTKQISLFDMEEETTLKDEDVERYIKLSYESEGMVGINHPYSYSQVSLLANKVFEKTNLVKFFVSTEHIVRGQIIGQYSEQAMKVPLISVLVEKKPKEDLLPKKRLLFFGQSYDKNTWTPFKEKDMRFYVYKFITSNNTELVLLSIDQLSVGEYFLTGMSVNITDKKSIGESSKLSIKVPFFFAQNITPRVLKYPTKDAFHKRMRELHVDERIKNYPFAVEIPGFDGLRILNHPEWFKWLMWAWLVHASKGMRPYPLHLMILADPGSGKSTLLNNLHQLTREFHPMYSGSSSTLKDLVPSFHKHPAKAGYLLEANRFAFCDEFLRALLRVNMNAEGGKNELLGFLNDLLEHQERRAGSGVSAITNAKMRARAIFTTNPVRGTRKVEEVLRKYELSSLSRMLVYHQTGEHLDLVRKSRVEDLELYPNIYEPETLLSLIDFLQSFHAKYEYERLTKIHAKYTPILNGDLLAHYSTRHMHHLECLIDGVVKTRCLFNMDTDYEATEKDYAMLEQIWGFTITSWVDPDRIKELPKAERARVLPENANALYQELVDINRVVTRLELQEIALKMMTKNDFYASVIMLKEYDLLHEQDGLLKPYFLRWSDTSDGSNV